MVPFIARIFSRRTTVMLAGVVSSALILGAIAMLPRFSFAIALLVMWGLVYAMISPVRQAYLNDLVPSKHRATVLSFDSLLGSAGGVATQPLLGRAADLWGYPISYGISAAIQLAAVPFVWLARREKSESDVIGGSKISKA